MDRGIPTEAVLAEMRASDPLVQYLVGTPKGRLSRLEKDVLTKGAFYLLFDGLKERLYTNSALQSCDSSKPRITIIGHSMGTMVANELFSQFPNLPYENIVYMAAASSVQISRQ